MELNEKKTQATLTEDDWIKIMHEWESSGQTQRAFCEARDLCVYRFKKKRTFLNKQLSKRSEGTFVSQRFNKMIGEKQTAAQYQLRFGNGMQLLVSEPFHWDSIKGLISLMQEMPCR